MKIHEIGDNIRLEFREVGSEKNFNKNYGSCFYDSCKSNSLRHR